MNKYDKHVFLGLNFNRDDESLDFSVVLMVSSPDFFRQPGDVSPIHSGIFWGSDFGPENNGKIYPVPFNYTASLVNIPTM